MEKTALSLVPTANEVNAVELTKSTPVSHKASVAWSILICAWVFYIYEYILRVSPGVIEKQLMVEFKTTATVVGAISGAYYFSYVPLQVPCGVIADRFGARIVVTVSALLCMIGCFMFALGEATSVALFARFLMGAGSACAYICCSKVAADWFSKDKFAILAGTTMFMGTLGGSFNTLFAMLVDALGWRTALHVCGATGLLVCVAAWTIMRDKPGRQTQVPSTDACTNDVSQNASPTLLTGLKLVAKNPQNWLIGIYGCAMYLPLSAFAELWGVSYLTKLYDVPAKVASRACIGVFLGMGIGSIVSAWISNKIESRNKVMSWAALGTLACFLVVFFVPNIPFSWMCALLFIGGLLSGGQTLYFTVAKEHTPLQYSATAIGFTNALVMCSALIFQPLLGKILDLTWSGQLSAEGVRIYSIDNYQMAFVAVAAAFVVGWALMQFVNETYTKDAKD